MEKTLDGNKLPSTVGDRVIDKPELPAGGISNENDVCTEVIAGEMHLKRGKVGRFEVFSDEAPRLGGTDKYPSPMSYLAMAVGF